ncbi:MAG: CvpA family protein [Chloroflexi bacterium]|nr:CvpA family protein [Chloroflexota bacterium]
MLHWIDLVIVAVVGWLTWRAFTVGLIREVVTLAAVLAGALLAGQLYAELAADIEFLIDDQRTRELVSFVAIFGGVVVIGQIGALLLRRVASLLLLGPFDRMGGAAFGFVKGVVVVEVLLIALTAFPAATQLTEAVEESVLAPLFLDGVPIVERLLPAEVTDALHSASSAVSGGLPAAP